MTGSQGMLAAKQPLVVPMLLRLSRFELSSYVVLVVSKQKGITLVFKTDPLQNVDINSTFDSISVIQKFIQREIEGQLRQMFREDLPGIIHRLSQQWVKAKVEAPYLSKRPPPIRRVPIDTMSNPELFARSPLGIIHPHLSRKTYSVVGSRRPRSVSGASAAKSSSPTKSAQSPPNELQSSSHSDIENFDPTYGLRPEGLPAKSGFKGFSSLFTVNKGLADLAEELETSEGSDYGEDGTSFDVVDWEDTVPSFSPASSVYHDRDDQHGAAPSNATAISGIYMRRPHSERRMSVTSTTTTNVTAEFLSTSPSNNLQADSTGNPKIVLRPNSNNSSIHQLSTLSHSNHTLSPYTRDLSHFTVRSVPPRNLSVAGQGIGGFAFGGAGGDRQPVKARRKRTYRISGRGKETGNNDKGEDSKPALLPPSPELDISEMDRYFSPGEFDNQQTPSQMELPSNRRQPLGSSNDPNNRWAKPSKTSIRSSYS
jgi:distribution and morphology protein 34